MVGVTHLAEHLLFRSLGADIVPIHGGITDDATVQFYVTGNPTEVAGFLNDIASAISTTPFDEADLLLERRIIEVENPHQFAPNAGLLTFRYGIGSVGNCHAGAPSLASITVGEVRDWIQTWLVAGNAHLTFSGPVPSSLDIRLPPGKRAEHRLSRRLLTKPTLVECEKSGVALSLLVDERSSAFIRDVVQSELSSVLRHRHGLIYSIDPEITPVEPGIEQVDWVLDPLDEDIPEVIDRAVSTLRRVADHGISQAAVETTRSACLSAMGDPDAWQTELDNLATAALVGGHEPTIAEYIELAHGLTSEALTTKLHEALDTLVVAYDEEVEIPEDLAAKHQLELDLFVTWETSDDAPRARARSWRGRRDLSLRDRAIIDGDVLWTRLFGVVSSVGFSDIAVVGEHTDGDLTVIDHRGRYLRIDPHDWWRGESLRQEVLSRVPEHVRRDFSWHGEDRPPRPTVETG